MNEAIEVHNVNFNDYETIEEKTSSIGLKILNITDKYPHDKCFIVASPLVISLMQADGRDRVFTPAIEGSFKGPNHTMLIGTLDDIKVYSYLYGSTDVSFFTEALIGYYDPTTNEQEIYKLTVSNFSFV